MTFATDAHAGSASSERPLVTALLIQSDLDDAREAAELMQSHVRSLRVFTARNLDEAFRILANESIDLVVTDLKLEDGACSTLAGAFLDWSEPPLLLVQIKGPVVDSVFHDVHTMPLLGSIPYEDGHRHLLRSPAQYLQGILRVREQSSENGGEDDALMVLQQVRRTISRIHHDVNNPLSIISGNAQLLLELAKALDLSSDLFQPLKDIEEASARVSAILRRLVDLRDRLPADEEAIRDVLADLKEPGGRC